MPEWLGTPDKYVQYCYEDQLSPKLLAIIDRWGFSFDEEYWYYRARRNPRIVKRAPIFMYPHKRMPAEKYHRPEAQKQLLF